MCDKDMDTCSHSESDEAANVCWANSMIQIIFHVIYPLYKELYKSYCYKIKHETIDMNNENHKSHVFICHHFFKYLTTTSKDIVAK